MYVRKKLYIAVPKSSQGVWWSTVSSSSGVWGTAPSVVALQPSDLASNEHDFVTFSTKLSTSP